MSLFEFVKHNELHIGSTKYFPHPYIKEYYSTVFSLASNLNILEIGIRDGISLRLWNDWFTNSKLYGLDILEYNVKNLDKKNNNSVYFRKTNAYIDSTIKKYKDNYFDFIIDDGPHTPETQVITIKKWFNKLKPKGKIIIEDIGCNDFNGNKMTPDQSLEYLIDSIDTNISTYQVFDLRDKGQYDSIILEITKL